MAIHEKWTGTIEFQYVYATHFSTNFPNPSQVLALREIILPKIFEGRGALNKGQFPGQIKVHPIVEFMAPLHEEQFDQRNHCV
jgi:hypothetical protein